MITILIIPGPSFNYIYTPNLPFMPATNGHILIVDDNQEMLDIVSLMLVRQAFSVSTQSRVADFIHEVKELHPDLILMDKSLGWADGCDLCALVKTDKDLQQIPVIMFSAYHKLKEDCLFAGADAFVEKPFLMAELLKAINALTTPGQVNMM